MAHGQMPIAIKSQIERIPINGAKINATILFYQFLATPF